MRASHRRILRWALGIVAATVALVALLMANVAAQLSGGWDEVFDRSHPQPGDPEVVAAREVGARAVEAEIDRVVAAAVPALTAGRVAQPAPRGADAVDEALVAGCEEGQHNWKRDDPFDLACWEVRRAILAGDAGEFRADMVALDAALLQAGWLHSYDDGLLGTLRYWDQYGRPVAGGPQDPSADPSAGGAPGDGYRLADLPSARYVSADGRFTLDLGFRGVPAYGQAEPELADDEYALVVRVDHASFRE
jgi:hypothetical protein